MAKIALIDDSEVACDWMVQQLTPFGYEIVTHRMSLGIQVFVRRTKPDLLLLDFNMPALNGDVACKLLRGHPDTAGVVIALYSSMDEVELQSRAIACGADGFVRKTDDVRRLVNDIEDLLLKKTVR